MRFIDALSAAGITSFLSGASQAEQLGSMPMPGTDTDTKFEILDSNVVLITDQGTVVSSTQELPQMYEVFDPMDTARKYPSASFTLGEGESKPLTVEMTRPVKGSKSLKSHETWECSVKAKSALDDGALYVFRADSTSDGEYPFIVGMNDDDKVSFDCKKVSSSTVSTE